MSGINKAIILGRLGAKPDVRYTQSNTAVANMSVATSQKWKDKNGDEQESTEWHRVVAWGRLAEICEKYLKKGSLVYFEGPIETRSWEDNEGVKRYTTKIKALTMQMCDSKGGTQGGVPHPAGGGGRPKGGKNDGGSKPVDSNVDLNESFDDIDDDLPF